MFKVCDKYGISSDKIVNKNNNILLSGEYQEIDNTLNFLINKLNISSDNIEKCPSVLYRNVDAISKKRRFFKTTKNGIFFYRIMFACFSDKTK